MQGIVVTFSLDLMAIPCLFPAKGDDAALTLTAKLNDLPIAVRLTSEQSPARAKADGSDRRFYFNKVSISITKNNENLANSDFIEGRARFLLMEFQHTVVEVLNRLIRFFKYEKRHPNLRPLYFSDFLSQEQQFCNPTWQTLDGQALTVSATPLTSGIITIPGLGLLRDDLFGIQAFTADEAPKLEQYLSSTNHIISLSEQLLSDAQSAALANNVRRAVLELAIAIEVFVKSAFFNQEKAVESVFEYLMDKVRETVKVTELLDSASLKVFGESFKTASRESYRHLDHVFRCRNQVAHKGEPRYRDDSGAWHEADQELLLKWWEAAIEMFAWLQNRIEAAKENRGRH